MAKEIILMADVEGLGGEGDVVTVADGYARNYLFPKNLAAPVTVATRRILEKKRREREEREAKLKAAAEETARKLEESGCTLTVKAGAEGKLFGSVTNADIAAALAEQGIEIERQKIVLEEPIRELGVYDLTVNLHADVKANLKVWVVEE